LPKVLVLLETLHQRLHRQAVDERTDHLLVDLSVVFRNPPFQEAGRSDGRRQNGTEQSARVVLIRYFFQSQSALGMTQVRVKIFNVDGQQALLVCVPKRFVGAQVQEKLQVDGRWTETHELQVNHLQVTGLKYKMVQFLVFESSINKRKDFSCSKVLDLY